MDERPEPEPPPEDHNPTDRLAFYTVSESNQPDIESMNSEQWVEMKLNDEYRETTEALPQRRALSESAPVPEHILSEIYANANIQVPRVNVNTDLSEAQVKAIVERFSVFDVWDTSQGALSLPKASTCIMDIETDPEVRFAYLHTGRALQK